MKTGAASFYTTGVIKPSNRKLKMKNLVTTKCLTFLQKKSVLENSEHF